MRTFTRLPIKSNYILVLGGAVITALWIFSVFKGHALGVDFFPLYFAAQQVLAGQSPYGAEATQQLMQVWDAPFASAGVAYPVPLILLVAPLTLFNFPIAASLWAAIGFVSSYACVLLVRHKSKLFLLLPLAYWPLHQAVVLGQATAVWFGLSIALVFAIRRNNRWLTAILIVLLALKPQAGLIFAFYGSYWLLRYHPKWIVLSAGFAELLVIGALVLQPNWISEWIEQVRLYSATVQPANMQILGLMVPLALWRYPKPWWATVAIFQVALFPIGDVYGTLPLLLAWCIFPLPVALVGAGASWLALLTPWPNSLGAVVLFVFLPLLLAALWETWPNRLRQRQLSEQPAPG